jgi:hypothetical protein
MIDNKVRETRFLVEGKNEGDGRGGDVIKG